MRPQLLIFLAVFQTILFSAHILVYETWLHFWGPVPHLTLLLLRVAISLLAFSFLATSLLSFKYWNAVTRVVYRISAVWLGLFNFLFLATLGSWLTLLTEKVVAVHWNPRWMIVAWFAAGIGAALWGMINASVPRIRRIKIRLPNLPQAWRGRTAAMISDLHLGPVRGANFARSIVARVRQLRPAIVFLAGDLYDGGHADLDELAGPLRGLNAPLGNFFVGGNHEEIRNPGAHLEAEECGVAFAE